MKPRDSLVLLVSLLLASACAARGPDFELPEAPVPAAFRSEAAAGESLANIPWWDLYEDPTLRSLIEAGLEHNRGLGEAMGRIAEARATLGVVGADLYPDVKVIGVAIRQETTGRDSVSAFDSRKLTLAASYEIDLWGRVARANEAAQQGLLATEEAFRTLTIALVADIARSYLVLRDLDARLAIAEETRENRRESSEILGALADGGLIPAVDADRADLALAETDAAVQSLIRARGQTENVISLLVGRLPADVERGAALGDQIVPPSVPAGLPSELLQRRPDVLMAERALHAQTALIGVADAARFPSISLTGTFGVKSTSLGDITAGSGFFNIGANLFGPIFNAGKSRRRVEVERARAEQLLNQYELVVLNAFREVEDALIAVETFQAEHDIRVRQLETALRALEIAEVLYEAGATGYLEVLDLQSSVFNTELKVSETLQLHHSAVVQLYKALGGGWSVVGDENERS